MCLFYYYLGCDTIVKTLLEHNADPNEAVADTGSTAINVASQEGHVGIVAVLLAHNADPNKALATGLSPVYAATQHGHTSVVKALLEHTADPAHVLAENGVTPLHAAAEHGDVEIAKLLLEHNADPNQARTDGGDGEWTPLNMVSLSAFRKPLHLREDAGGTIACCAPLLLLNVHVRARCIHGRRNLLTPTRSSVVTSSYSKAEQEGHTAVADMFKQYVHI